MSFIYS